MGAIITADDLKPSTPSGGGFSVKEFEGMMGLLERMFDKAIKLKQMKEANSGNQTLQSSPVGVPQQVVNTPTKEVIIHQKKELDETKVKQFIEELIVKIADKLPDDIKEMKIGDIVGENFKNFKYSIRKMGVTFEIDHSVITEELTKQFMETIPKLEK